MPGQCYDVGKMTLCGIISLPPPPPAGFYWSRSKKCNNEKKTSEIDELSGLFTSLMSVPTRNPVARRTGVVPAPATSNPTHPGAGWNCAGTTGWWGGGLTKVGTSCTRMLLFFFGRRFLPALFFSLQHHPLSPAFRSNASLFAYLLWLGFAGGTGTIANDSTFGVLSGTRSPTVGWILGQRRRRWPNIQPTVGPNLAGSNPRST